MPRWRSAGFDTTVTAGAVFELLRDAGELVPGVSELVLDELSAGLRPATPDNCPVIGPGDAPGLHWAIGHHRNGILLTPITAELVADALAGVAPTELAGALAPGRFATAAPAANPAAAGAGASGQGEGEGRPMIVTINGERREIPSAATVATVIELLGVGAGSPRGGGGARRRGRQAGRWTDTQLPEGALIEVVAAIQGG